LVQHPVGEVLPGVELEHLADLLLDGHATEQVGDAVGGGQGRIEVRGSGGHAELSDEVRTAVTAADEVMPLRRRARARSPAERGRGFTYSSMPELIRESATPRMAMQRPAGTYH